MTRILGIEGTAWAASAAVYDTGDDSVRIESDPYVPESGGIHPREAAEHMQEAVPRVVGTVLDGMDGSPDVVAFSRGPGLGPCLRIAGTAARALALSLDVPLVGVNHMVAHAEIGRHRSGFSDPVCLNASGANAHVLAYRGGRYRVLGETMDTGVGNAIDKFARHVGWSHPGGPKVERAAEGGEYVDLPYVVKGMDFSFSGLSSAAQDAYDELVEAGSVGEGSAPEPAAGSPPDPDDVDGPLVDLCFSFQETVFAMLAEVAERALSLTGGDELVLGGGVAQNARLRAMLAGMCDARGARFFAPEPRFLRDNAGMIAVLGAKMFEAGDVLTVADSRVLPDFRPDEVAVTWRDPVESSPRPADATEVRGAEAVVEIGDDVVEKRRLPKSYRHPALDDRLRRERTAVEARLLAAARRLGVPTPVVLDVDGHEHRLRLERVGEADLDAALTEGRVRAVGAHLAALHGAGFVHGDPTTRNVRVSTERVYLVDFGLGFHTDDVEDFAMDLHVLARSLAGTAPDPEPPTRALLDAYAEVGDPAVLDRLAEIEGRGRYRGG